MVIFLIFILIIAYAVDPQIFHGGPNNHLTPMAMAPKSGNCTYQVESEGFVNGGYHSFSNATMSMYNVTLSGVASGTTTADFKPVIQTTVAGNVQPVAAATGRQAAGVGGAGIGTAGGVAPDECQSTVEIPCCNVVNDYYFGNLEATFTYFYGGWVASIVSAQGVVLAVFSGTAWAPGAGLSLPVTVIAGDKLVVASNGNLSGYDLILAASQGGNVGHCVL